MVASVLHDQRRRRRWIGLNVAVQILICISTLLTVNGWAFRHSWRLDFSPSFRYKPFPETIRLLESLPSTVRVVVPFRLGRSLDDRARARVLAHAVRVCREFEHVTPAFQLVAQIDVGADPAGWAQAKESYGISEVNRVYLLAGDRQESVSVEEMAKLQSFGPERPTEVAAERVQEALTNAIQRVIRPERPVIVFSQGHGEISLQSPLGQLAVESFRRTLVERGYAVEGADLHLEPVIPSNARLLILAPGPDFMPWGDAARRELERYCDRGGRLLVFLPEAARTGLESILERAGLVPREGLVATIGPVPGQRSQPTLWLFCSATNTEHPMSRDLDPNRFRAEIQRSRALALSAGSRPILLSPRSTWLETGRILRRDAGETTGPFVLVGAAEIPGDADSPVSRIVVHGSWLASLDLFFGRDNRRLLLNAVYWLTDRPELIAESGWRESVRKRVELTPGVRRAFFWMSLVVLPACSILAGFFTFWLRRR